MSLADKIIAQVDSGASHKQIADANPWQAINPDEKQRLFSEAEIRSTSDDKPITLLYAVYHMAEKAHSDWDSARALALILRRPDVELKDKKRGLDKLRRILEQVRWTLRNQDSVSIRSYKLYQADYHALMAETAYCENSLDQALVEYRQALAIWEKYGVTDRVEWAHKQIARLDDISQGQQALVPLTVLTDERTRLREEIADIQAKIDSAKTEFSALGQRIKSLAANEKLLESETQAEQALLKKLRAQEEAQRSRLSDLKGEITQSEAALQFLLVLPRAATAPLWLEVLKLALAQGKIDTLALQAMERLSIQCSEEGLPILAEIVARLPDGQRIDPVIFDRVSSNWILGISRAIARTEVDTEDAARELITAWSGFFGEVKQEVDSAG